MSPHNNYLSKRIYEVASRHYPSCQCGYQSFEHFHECLACCYYVIASRYSHGWHEQFGSADYLSTQRIGDCIHTIKGCNIPREEFSNAVVRIGTSRTPYKPCLDSLIADKVIHCNESYSNTKGHSFTKSYSIHNDFMSRAIGHYLATDGLEAPFDIYSAICIKCPDSLSNKQIRKARKIYKSIGPINGIRLLLPQRWEQTNDDGRFKFNEKLNAEILIRDMEYFKSQKDCGYKYGRHYDWFTLCSSAFRHYLYVGDKHHREIIDCPSGIFLMLAIAGYNESKISYNEAHNLIFNCLRGSFYSEMSGQPKTPLLKQAFMRIVHCTNSQYSQIENRQPYKTIIDNVASHYPDFWNFIQEKRASYERMGLEMHIESTRIERIIMEQLSDFLSDNGYARLIRVHDALWGIEDIANPSEYLYGIILTYLITFCRTDYNWYYSFDTHNRDSVYDVPIISSTLNSEYDTHNRDKDIWILSNTVIQNQVLTPSP